LVNMKPIITIGKGVVGENLPTALIKKIKKDLTFKNPDYENAMKFGKFISADMPSHLHLFDIEDDNAWVPRGYIHWLMKWMHNKKVKFTLRDKTLLLKPLNLKFIGKLRDYQDVAMTPLSRYPCGVLEAATGSGKTVIGINMIVKRQQPTLVIVHSKELMYQWKDQIKSFIGLEAGLVGDGKFNIQPVTIGIINTVRNKVEQLEPHFGHIICDEVHRITSESWAGTMQGFRARYTLGLTATPFRADGLGNAIFASIGPLRCTINKKELQKRGTVLTPDIYRIKSKFNYMFLNDYSTMISSLIEDTQRNNLIVRGIAADFNKHNEHILIVSDRQKHLKIMQEMLHKKYNIFGHILTGSVADKKRKTIIEEVKSGKCKILFATTSLIGEGFDLDKLNCLCLATPIKYSGRLIQAIGRILRPDKDNKRKTPRVYDIRDENVSVLQYSGYNRDRIYKKEWNR